MRLGAAGKPGSVSSRGFLPPPYDGGSGKDLRASDGHFSADAVADAGGTCVPSTRPDPTIPGPGTRALADPREPAWACTRWGLPCPVCHQTGGALLPHPFTLT